MAIYVIGGTGSSELWEIDTDKGTVRPFQAGSGADGVDQDTANKIQAMRKNGFAVVKGVDFAVAVTGSADLTYRQLTDNR